MVTNCSPTTPHCKVVETGIFLLVRCCHCEQLYHVLHDHRGLSHEAKQLLFSAVEQPVPRGLQHHPVQPLARLTERHFPAQLEKSASGSQLQRNCAVCSNKKGRGRKTTTFICKQCNIPMCIIPCFELHHTKVDPQRYL